MRVLLLLLLIAFYLSPAAALASSLGQNITIWDGNSNTEAWHGTGEDNETEPGMVGDQIWDLEGFFLNQNSLSMVGGYNFKDGAGNNPVYTSGDIFLSDNGAPIYGDIHRKNDGISGNNNDGYNEQNPGSLTSTYGYEYVIDLTFIGENGGTYSVFSLDSNTILKTAYYQQNEGSSPWQYEHDSNILDTALKTGAFSFFDNLTDGDTGFLGDTHYALTGFDLSFLGHGTEFYAHFTMGCGNDNLMGQGTVVPEPSTFVLFAAGGGLLWLTGRRKRK